VPRGEAVAAALEMLGESYGAPVAQVRNRLAQEESGL
jgi:hypothetical protein